MDQTSFFFDGETNRKHTVTPRFGATLDLLEDDVRIASWNYADIRRSDSPSGIWRLSNVTAPPLARLEIRDPATGHALERLCPALAGPGGTPAAAVGRIALWSLVAAAAIIATIWFGMPLLADSITEILPLGWERPLGDATDKQIRAGFSDKSCATPEGSAALDKLADELQGAAHLRIPPRPVVLKSVVPNAFAVPGGRVYILSNLLEKAKSPDELAGVLAHEFGHVAHRDGVRRIIRDGGTGFLIGLLFGDVTGGSAMLGAARSLLSAAYSREVEAGADGFAIDVMHRLGRPTEPMGDLLLRLTGPGDQRLSLLMDHPLTPERTQRLKDADAPVTGAPLLTDAEWHALQAICR